MCIFRGTYWLGQIAGQFFLFCCSENGKCVFCLIINFSGICICQSDEKAGIGIFILQRYCGIGLGRQLMEYAIENARKTELEQLKLGVFDDNVAAIRLYEKLGFREWGREPHAFKLKDGSYRDEIQMVLFLS